MSMESNGAPKGKWIMERQRTLPKVMVVDDEAVNREIIQAMMAEKDWEIITADGGRQALDQVERHALDVVVCDIKMDGIDGIAVLKHMLAYYPMVPVIMLTGYVDLDTAVEVMRLGARDYLTKPLAKKDLLASVERSLYWREKVRTQAEGEQERTHYQQELERRLESTNLAIRQAMLETLVSMARAMDLRSPDLAAHHVRTTRLATRIGRTMGLPEERMVLLQQASSIHDIGKLALPDRLLSAFIGLGEPDWQEYIAHARYSADILEPMQGLSALAPITAYHHQHFDGSSDPGQPAGQDIPLEARILSVADYADHLGSGHYGPQDDLANLVVQKRGSVFDPEVVDAWLKTAGGDTVS